MTELGSVFLIDTNVFITPSNEYYPFDFARPFWDFMGQNIISGKIKILSSVYAEIVGNDHKDELQEWLPKYKDKVIESLGDMEVVNNVARILDYIVNCRLYKEKGASKWVRQEIADKWLVATAMAHDSIIVTFERPNKPGSFPGQASEPKIPIIADHFKASHMDLFKMLRLLKFKF